MINQVTVPARCHCFARTWRGSRTRGRVKRTTSRVGRGSDGAAVGRARGEGKRSRRRRVRESTGKDQGRSVSTGVRESGTRGYTENISLLEKFSTPLSASIVIYARDEGGYGRAIPQVLDPAIPWTRRRRMVRAIVLNEITKDPPCTGGPYQAGRRREPREGTRSTFRLSDTGALPARPSRNLTPHLSTIIQFRGGSVFSRRRRRRR